MSHAAFWYVLDYIRGQLKKKKMTEEPLPPDFRLSVTIYKLSREEYILEKCVP